MGVFWVSNENPKGNHTAEHEKAYEDVNTLFVGAVIQALANRLQDVYLCNKTGKYMWDALNNAFGG
jgi:hypothetical protein